MPDWAHSPKPVIKSVFFLFYFHKIRRELYEEIKSNNKLPCIANDSFYMSKLSFHLLVDSSMFEFPMSCISCPSRTHIESYLLLDWLRHYTNQRQSKCLSFILNFGKTKHFCCWRWKPKEFNILPHIAIHLKHKEPGCLLLDYDIAMCYFPNCYKSHD